jgi:hypothetical protein
MDRWNTGHVLCNVIQPKRLEPPSTRMAFAEIVRILAFSPEMAFV